MNVLDPQKPLVSLAHKTTRISCYGGDGNCPGEPSEATKTGYIVVVALRCPNLITQRGALNRIQPWEGLCPTVVEAG